MICNPHSPWLLVTPQVFHPPILDFFQWKCRCLFNFATSMCRDCIVALSSSSKFWALRFLICCMSPISHLVQIIVLGWNIFLWSRKPILHKLYLLKNRRLAVDSRAEITHHMLPHLCLRSSVNKVASSWYRCYIGPKTRHGCRSYWYEKPRPIVRSWTDF